MYIDSNTTNSILASENPIRYRSYYYDVEIQLYWVSSRYYTPELCTWISPDSIEYLYHQSINGLNLYCYCYNNPVNYYDPSGHSPEWWQWLISGLEVAAGIGVPLGAFVGSVTTYWIDYGWKGIDWNKALVTGVIACGSSFFPTLIGEVASKFHIYDKALYFVNAYNTILTSTANSIINVYWREKILKSKVMKFRPCNGRSISFSVLTFMLFFITTLGILPNVEGEDKKIAFIFAIILFLLHVLFVLYSLLKLNSPIYLDEDKIFQKQFGKIISIKYDKINDVKLSFSYYVRASYGIKIYENNKKIMFEITSKVFDEFMKYCSNIEVKNKIESLLKEKGIY